MRLMKIAVLTLVVCLLIFLFGCGQENEGVTTDVEGSSSESSFVGDKTDNDDEGTNKEYYEQILSIRSSSGNSDGAVINNLSDKEIVGEYRIIKTYEELVRTVGNECGATEELFKDNCVIYISRWYNYDWGEQYGFKELTFSSECAKIEYYRPWYEDEMMVSPAVTHYEDYIVVRKHLIPNSIEEEGVIIATENKLTVEAPLDSEEDTKIEIIK